MRADRQRQGTATIDTSSWVCFRAHSVGIKRFNAGLIASGLCVGRAGSSSVRKGNSPFLACFARGLGSGKKIPRRFHRWHILRNRDERDERSEVNEELTERKNEAKEEPLSFNYDTNAMLVSEVSYLA